MSKSATANNWDNKWDQSPDLTYDGTKNLYTGGNSTNGKFSGTWSVYKTPEEKAAEEVNALITKYYNSGTYTKETNIYLNETAVNKLNQNGGFHQTDELSRTTYYKPTELWMSKTTSNGETKYSYYGTAANGDLTSATTSEPLVTPSNPGTAATKSHSNWHNTKEDGMEGFYITLKDIVATVAQKWSNVNNGYETTDSTVIEWFKAFCAPCYLGFNTGTANYVDLVKVRVEEKNELLSLKLYAAAGNYGLLSKHDNTTNTPDVFAAAGVYLGDRTKTYTVSNTKSFTDGALVYAWAWGTTIADDAWYTCTLSGTNYQFVAPKGMEDAIIIRYNKDYSSDVKTWDKSVILHRADNVLTKTVSWSSPERVWTLVGKINGVEAWGTDLRMINDGGDVWTITLQLKAGDSIKCRLNKAWDESYGKGGSNYDITTAGTYEVKYVEGSGTLVVTKKS